MWALRSFSVLRNQHSKFIQPSEMADNPLISNVVERNICSLIEAIEKEEKAKSLQEHLADRITAFSGSMAFVFLHALWFMVWVPISLGWLGIKPFDPYPFGLLTMIVSLEAIFLSTFVLLSQNRMQAAADKRADLDLQINLLAEHEITRLVTLVDAIADRMGIDEGQDPEMDELKKDIEPELVLEEIERRGRKENNQ
jgi:uncharacterized membrane protein